ncbi:hypothetical protein JCM8547_005671 [Rhodosporidiobolus lusitaniae]
MDRVFATHEVVEPESFSDASSHGREPCIPIVSRTQGLQGYTMESNQQLPGGDANEEKLEDEVGEWRDKVEEERRRTARSESSGSPVSPQASPDREHHFPSIALGSSPQRPIGETLFLSTSRHADELDEPSVVESWRNALKEAHNGPPSPPRKTPSTPRPINPRPPVIVLPPSPRSPLSYASNDATPLAHPAQQSRAASYAFGSSFSSSAVECHALASDFSLFHGDAVNPAALPLPNVPTDYVFPDQRGRASFSSQPISPPQSQPSSPSLEPTTVFPASSTPSSFSGLPSPLVASPPPPAVKKTLHPPPPPLKHSSSSGESLIDLYSFGAVEKAPNGIEHDSDVKQDEEGEGGEVKVERLEKEIARLQYEREALAHQLKEAEERKSFEGFLREKGVDPTTLSSPILFLPSSFSRLSHCPRCTRPLDLPSSSLPSHGQGAEEPAYYPAANPFLRSYGYGSVSGWRDEGFDEPFAGVREAEDENKKERERMQLWADEHWGCLPFLSSSSGAGGGVGVGEGWSGGGGRVRVVALDEWE